MTWPADLEQWQKLWAEFDALIELDARARVERLAAIGASDPAARRTLEELLEADTDAGARLAHLDAAFGAPDHGSEPAPGAGRDVLDLVGHTVAHFRIVEPLATGGMGVVYRAVDTRLDRPVALKFPLPGRHLDRQVHERFLREARAAGALDHPNICSIYETGETEDGQLFLAMPLYAGETLKARLARAGRLPIGEALAIAVQIARGLSAAHRADIVHRDLKPANVIILLDGGVKILDFGIARVGEVGLTGSHRTVGTVAYMAPEQISDEQLDGRADLWALGVLLYEMLTGQRPFAGRQDIAVAHAIAHSNPVRPSAHRPEIWPALDALILGLLARDPGRRRASAEAVVAELTGLESQSAPGRRRWRVPLPSRIALIVVAAGTAAWLLAGPPSARTAEPRQVTVMSNDTAYLAVALADEIATQLSWLSAVTLVRDPSAAVVRVSASRAGEDVRLVLALFDNAPSRPVWTQDYVGPASAIPALQHRATEGIIGALGLVVTRSERAARRRGSTENAPAYDLYLRGRAAQHVSASNDSSQRVVSLLHAQSYYARARDRDPGFAAPRARLALSHLALAQNDRTSARIDQARREAEAALRLQPGVPEAHEALATYWLLRGDRVEAISELQRALTGRPNAPDLYALLATNLRQVGRWDEAASAAEHATRLDPRNRQLHQLAALTYGRMRRYEAATAHWDRAIAIDSARDPFPQMIRGFVYLRRGNVDSLDAAISRIPLGLDRGGMTSDARGMVTYARYTAHRIVRRHAAALASLDSARFAISEDRLLYRPVALLRAQTLEGMGDAPRARASYAVARALLEDSVAAHPRDSRMRIALGLAYAGLGQREDAMREARTATEVARASENMDAMTAFMGGVVEIYAQLGEADAALELIELLLTLPAGREISVPLLRLDPTYDRLRSDPRFDALLRRFSSH